jgi:hypothetical protein
MLGRHSGADLKVSATARVSDGLNQSLKILDFGAWIHKRGSEIGFVPQNRLHQEIPS